jgi:hypothetical protein
MGHHLQQNLLEGLKAFLLKQANKGKQIEYCFRTVG